LQAFQGNPAIGETFDLEAVADEMRLHHAEEARIVID
jgi:hypothetical protein